MTATPRKEFYGQDIQIKERNGDKTVYSLDGDDGRIQAAANMLSDTSFTIMEIAGRVGYENPGKFSAAFKEIMELTPGGYRKKTIGFLD